MCVDSTDMSSDNATLLSYYSSPNNNEAALEENANSDVKQTITPSSAPDSTNNTSNTKTISRSVRIFLQLSGIFKRVDKGALGHPWNYLVPTLS